jgi:hypothetical protein
VNDRKTLEFILKETLPSLEKIAAQILANYNADSSEILKAILKTFTSAIKVFLFDSINRYPLLAFDPSLSASRRSLQNVDAYPLHHASTTVARGLDFIHC